MLAFLQDLDITADERSKLASLGAGSPLALLSMRKAATPAFDALLGAERAAAVADQLAKLLSPEDLKTLQQPQSSPRRFGARPPTNSS